MGECDTGELVDNPRDGRRHVGEVVVIEVMQIVHEGCLGQARVGKAGHNGVRVHANHGLRRYRTRWHIVQAHHGMRRKKYVLEPRGVAIPNLRIWAFPNEYGASR